MSMPMDPMAVPSPVTPHDTPSYPAGYDAVTPDWTAPRPAPYDIQAPLDDLSGVLASAGALAGAGVLYPQGPRQAATQALLSSPEGYGEQDILQGYSGSGDGPGGWPGNVEPPESYTVATGTD